MRGVGGWRNTPFARFDRHEAVVGGEKGSLLGCICKDAVSSSDPFWWSVLTAIIEGVADVARLIAGA